MQDEHQDEADRTDESIAYENEVPPRDDASVQENEKKRTRRGFRFGLLELLLLTAAVASWLPFWHAGRKIPILKSEIDVMLAASSRLIIMDEDQINAKTLPSIWSSISSWKYSVPPDADLELRLATEGINSLGLPNDYQARALPTGEHTVHLKVTSDAQGSHSEVFLDDQLVLEEHHAPEWLKSSGSSSSGSVAKESKAYPMDKPLRLKSQRFSVGHPLKKYGSVNVPDEYDNKGNLLWISPRTLVPEPAPNFTIPPSTFALSGWGHRQGTKIIRMNQSGMVGLIGIQPSLNATLGDQRRNYSYCPIAISVRPVLNSESPPEIPEELSPQQDPGQSGIPFLLTDSIATPKVDDQRFSRQLVTKESIAKDGKSMRVFAHFKPFPSGAQPIVEILFDAAHPNRIGFLPHAAAGSVPIRACQLVTQFDAAFFWRQMEMLSEPAPSSDATNQDTSSSSESTSLVSLAEFYPSIDFQNFADTVDSELFAWQRVPLERLPVSVDADQSREHFRMTLKTDVIDSTKIKYPASVNRKWRYEGIANQQIWWLPFTSDDAESNGTIESADPEHELAVEFRGGAVFPGTKTPIPGGPVMQNVRVTLPMPAKEPVWLEISPEPGQPTFP